MQVKIHLVQLIWLEHELYFICELLQVWSVNFNLFIVDIDVKDRYLFLCTKIN